MVQAIEMPGVLNDSLHGNHVDDLGPSSGIKTTYHSTDAHSKSNGSQRQSSERQSRSSTDRPLPAVDGLPGGWPQTPGALLNANGSVKDGFGGTNGSVLSVPDNVSARERAPSAKSIALSTRTRRSSYLETGSEKRSGEIVKEDQPRPGAAEEGYFMALGNGKPSGPPRSPHSRPTNASNGDSSTPHRTVSGPVPGVGLAPVNESSPAIHQATEKTSLKPAPTPHAHRASSPPAFSREDLPSTASVLSHTTSRPARLEQRHTLEVPKVITARNSADGRQENSASADGPAYTSGRFSPNTPTKRRGSLQLARRVTRSIHSHSDMQLDQVPQDEDAARWTEHVKAKRAKKSRVDTDDDRVVIGKKVDESHQNYVRMYNMLTGIRFVVSRIHAKMDRELNDADFLQAQKYSFDITGGELTPSAKYDFKFKDYAPWVFRHIRIAFGIDPADYLVSLTAKYILSELGSPGKSGSFFYFSRDYKYIIKTIHHAEHKFLRRILKDYYRHVRENPNTLLSQFYGLHRVKLPYGKKIHFIVMNNLFPPHRDIHRTFDLKGSTIGRDFKEEDLEKNPRATLKDLNWLRRNLHLEFGPTKKEAFVAQMQKDVAFLQRSKIMDYSLLVGIHDLEKGNEENLRDKTLQVFQPGGEKGEEPQAPGQLTRTPSKMESAKRARELRDAVKKERPIPLAQAADKMPDEAHRKGFYFYQDDGGFQATHEDDSPGEEIYYLGIIDCLTKYNFVKKAEHFWKGMGGHESQISPIPPERYGERFVKFIAGITMSRQQAEKVRLSTNLHSTAGIVIPPGIEGTLDDPRLSSSKTANPPGTDKVIEEAELEAERSRRHGHSEAEAPDRTISAVRSPGEGIEAATLPVIGEAAESASNTSRTPRITPTHSYESLSPHQPVVGNANMLAEAVGEVPPPTPPKADGTAEARDFDLGRGSWGARPPPTPPRDALQGDRRIRAIEKTLPLPPEIQARKVFSRSPSQLVEEEVEKARTRVSG